MDTQQPTSLGQTVLAEVRLVRGEVETLRQFADLLGKRHPENNESFMQVVTRLLALLVAGTEETHRRVEALHAALTEPGITRAMRQAILED